MHPDDPHPPGLQRRAFIRGSAVAAGMAAAAATTLARGSDAAPGAAPLRETPAGDPLARMVEIAERCGPELGLRATRR